MGSKCNRRYTSKGETLGIFIETGGRDNVTTDAKVNTVEFEEEEWVMSQGKQRVQF